MLGRITTAAQLLNYGTIPLGALLIGSVASTTSPRTAILVGTAIAAVAPAVLLFGPLPRMRDLPIRDVGTSGRCDR
jgi:hypothetical protein